jgi:hypothetical protein
LAAAVAVLCYALRDYVLAGVDLERVWIRMFALFDSQSSEVIAESVRPELWADGLGLWLAHPVFGVGFAGYPLWGQTGARHPHNYFVELLAELGIVGLVLGGLLAILAIRCVLQEFRRDPPWSLTAARAIWVFLFCCAMLSGDLTDNRMMFAFMALTLVSGSPERGRVTGVRTRAAAAAVAAGPVARPAALRGLPSFAAAGARESTSNATAARASSPGRTPPGLPTSRGGQRCS